MNVPSGPSPSGQNPLFSVVLRSSGTTPENLRAAVESVHTQSWRAWELLVDTDLDRAIGDFVIFVDADGVLTPGALARMADAVKTHDDVDVLYADEVRRLSEGAQAETIHKPAWSPERLRSQYYCGTPIAIRSVLVHECGGFRPDFEGAELHDLVLRVSERARRIVHLPEVLLHRTVETGNVTDPLDQLNGRRAVQEHLDRIGIDAAVEITDQGTYRLQRKLSTARRVSVVIPTRGTSSLVWGRHTALVVQAVESALSQTTHPQVEVVVVYDTVTPDEVLASLYEVAGERLVLVPYDEEFNYSRKMNLGVLASTGDRLVLLNDDVLVRSDEWLEKLLAPLEEPDVGMTGARLYFSSTAIQHVGLAFSRGTYRHPWRLTPADAPGIAVETRLNREVSGVTGACVGIRRDTYLQVGGLTERLREAYNDVDFAYKLTHAGYRTILVADCELFHFESQTRDAIPDPENTTFLRGRWGVPSRDPFTPCYPNLPKATH